MDEILTSANQMATDYYRERQTLVAQQAERVARGVGRDVDLSSPDQRALRDLLLSDLALSHDVTLQVYRVKPATAMAGPELEPVFDVTGDTLPCRLHAHRGRSPRRPGLDGCRRAACGRSHGRRHR